MAEWVNVKHKGLGDATALVTRQALDLVFADKGWEEVAPAEAAKLHRARARKINEEAKAQSVKDQASMAAELASQGVDPGEVGVEVSDGKSKAKSS